MHITNSTSALCDKPMMVAELSVFRDESPSVKIITCTRDGLMILRSDSNLIIRKLTRYHECRY